MKTIPTFQSHNVGHGYGEFYIDERYINFKAVPEGSYGVCVTAEDNVTGKKVNIKKYKDFFNDKGNAKRTLRELKLIRHLESHENIISTLDLMSNPLYTPQLQDLYIVNNAMDAAFGKILRSQTLTNAHFQFFLYQILRGLQYIQSAGILLRDLRPSALLVNESCELQFSDFYSACPIPTDDGINQHNFSEYVITYWYRAPELLYEYPSAGKPVDIWSVGCILAEMLQGGKSIFCGNNPIQQLEIILQKMGCPAEDKLNLVSDPKILAHIMKYEGRRPLNPFHAYFPLETDELALDLLSKMLEFHPNDRITVEEALKHEYLKDFWDDAIPVASSFFTFVDYNEVTEDEVMSLDE
jgi:serine/threonine protein kinase